MNGKFKSFKTRQREASIERAIAHKEGHIAGAITVLITTVAVIIWEYSKYTGSHFGNIAAAAALSGLISVICFFISITEITNALEQIFFCSEKFSPEDATAIRCFAVARFLIAIFIVYVAMSKGIPWIHSVLLSPADLAFLHNIGIL